MTPTLQLAVYLLPLFTSYGPILPSPVTSLPCCCCESYCPVYYPHGSPPVPALSLPFWVARLPIGFLTPLNTQSHWPAFVCSTAQLVRFSPLPCWAVAVDARCPFGGGSSLRRLRLLYWCWGFGGARGSQKKNRQAIPDRFNLKKRKTRCNDYSK